LELESLDDSARPEHDRPRRAHRPLRPPAIGGREHLLRGHVRDVATSPGRGRLAPEPDRLREEADEQIGAGPAVAERVEAPPVDLLPPRLEPGDVLLPGGDRIALVPPDRT